MKLLKPVWVNHNGRPIFSLDIHPDGTRVATGGQGTDSGRVVIWNMSPIINEDIELKENIPRVLCQMDNHLACVNSVRWSLNGKYLASAGDDKVIIIWTIGVRYANGEFGVNTEQYRAVTTLRAHSGDILDLSWSPADNWLASCSVDNSIIIWNALKWSEIVTVLRGHTGLVKGVTWDPIGKYLASQSDDKSLRVWRVSDWTEETVITAPFVECGGTTHVLRLCWSPDGQFLVSAHAMNNSGSVAQVIERQDWTTNRDFVGHRKAIACVRFNPNIMCLPSSEKSIKSQKLCCTAIGSRDRSLSVWLTSRRRPIVVIHDLFDNSVLDLSWSQNGYQLMACSWDGTVAFIEFTQKEIGNTMSCDEKVLYKQKLYGKSLQSTSTSHDLIEDPDLMVIHEQKKQQNGNQSGSNESSNKMATNDSRSSAMSKLNKGPTDKQIEVRLADGRRRITPLYIPPTDGIAYNAMPTTFSSSSEAKTKIIIEKHDESNSSVNSMPQSKQQVQQIKALPNMNTKPIKVKSKIQSESAQIGSTGANSSNQKRKSISTDLSQSKRKPGRPPVSQKESQKQCSEAIKPLIIEPIGKTAAKHSVKEGRSSPSSNFYLPALKIDKNSSIKLFTKGDKKDLKKIVVDIENNINSTVLCALRLNENEERLWQVLMSSKINGIAGNEQLIACACDDNTLSVFTTTTGRRLHTPIILNAPIARLMCSGYKIMIITTKAILWLWDFTNHKVIIKEESLLPLLIGNDVTILSTGITDSGSPLICVSTGKSYIFNVQFGSWTLISNSNDILNSCTDQKPHSFDPSSLPLSSIQSQTKFNKSMHTLFLNNPYLQQTAVLSYIDQQLAASFVIGSTKEYRFWLMSLAQQLSKDNMESRLREMCQYLIGPLFKSSKSEWDPKILGNDKHEMLKEVLSILASNLRLQRLYTEFKEQMELISNA